MTSIILRALTLLYLLPSQGLASCNPRGGPLPPRALPAKTPLLDPVDRLPNITCCSSSVLPVVVQR